MPYLYIRVAAPEKPQLAERIASNLQSITARVLGKREAVTSISIDFAPAAPWFVGGASVAEQQLSTFYLNIKITEGTNTKDQKAAYVEQVFAAMQSLLGPLAPAAYIVIDDVRADAWGFDGQTQEYRYVSSKAL